MLVYYFNQGGRQTIIQIPRSFDTSRVAWQKLISVEQATGDRALRRFTAPVNVPAPLCAPDANSRRIQASGPASRLGSLRFGGSTTPVHLVGSSSSIKPQNVGETDSRRKRRSVGPGGRG